jgi:hypothetical protein
LGAIDREKRDLCNKIFYGFFGYGALSKRTMTDFSIKSVQGVYQIGTKVSGSGREKMQRRRQAVLGQLIVDSGTKAAWG